MGMALTWLFWVVLIAVLAMLIGWSYSNRKKKKESSKDPALDMLKQRYAKGEVTLFSLAAFGLAAFVEFMAVFWLRRWAYKETMPVIFGIGLSPLVQLWITGVGALWLSHELLYGRGLLLKE
jgi:hypothetical protein